MWNFNESNLTLNFNEWPGYQINLERCATSAQVLDWIAQIAQKTWATPEIVGALVKALDRCLDLQGNLCGCGVDHRLDVREWLRSLAGRKHYALWSEEFEEFFKDWRKDNGHPDYYTPDHIFRASEEFLTHKGVR